MTRSPGPARRTAGPASRSRRSPGSSSTGTWATSASNPVANGQARYESCQAADGTLGGCEGPEPEARRPATAVTDRSPARPATSSVASTRAPRNAADPVSGEGDELYVVVEASVPGTERPTGTTYGTIVPGTASQGAIYFTKTENGGQSWSPLTRIDAAAEGQSVLSGHRRERRQTPRRLAGHPRRHRNGPETASCEHGSVREPARPRTRLEPSRARPACRRSIRPRRTEASSWTTSLASSVAIQRSSWEQFGNRDIPFFGDYNYDLRRRVDTVLMDLGERRSERRSRNDPRYTNGDGTDGFDVFQCRACSGTPPSSTQTRRPNAGGLDQNIWAWSSAEFDLKWTRRKGRRSPALPLPES